MNNQCKDISKCPMIDISTLYFEYKYVLRYNVNIIKLWVLTWINHRWG